MNDKERARVAKIHNRHMRRPNSAFTEDEAWLLDLVERQEARIEELERTLTASHNEARALVDGDGLWERSEQPVHNDREALVERVAEAMRAFARQNWNGNGFSHFERYRELARAALAVIEEDIRNDEASKWKRHIEIARSLGELSPEPQSVAEAREAVLKRMYWTFAKKPTNKEIMDALIAAVRADTGLDMQDFAFMVENTAKAFDAVTGGRASKPMTHAHVIERLVEERIEEREREVQGARDEALPTIPAFWSGSKWQTFYIDGKWMPIGETGVHLGGAFPPTGGAAAPTQETPEKSNRAV